MLVRLEFGRNPARKPDFRPGKALLRNDRDVGWQPPRILVISLHRSVSTFGSRRLPHIVHRDVICEFVVLPRVSLPVPLTTCG